MTPPTTPTTTPRAQGTSSEASAIAGTSTPEQDPCSLSRPWQIVNALAGCALFVALGVAFVVDPHAADVSEVEARTLAKVPSFSWEALPKGEYTRKLDEYVADHFPFRETFVAVAFWIKEHRGFRTEERFYNAPAVDQGGLESGADWLEKLADAGPADDDADVVDAGAVVDAGVRAVRDPKASARRVKDGVLILPDRALMLFAGDETRAAKHADVVNAYAEAFVESSVQVHSVVTPTATDFYVPEKERARMGSEKVWLEAIAERYREDVAVADVWSQLEEHKDERIFLRTDHHWTALGAYYGYVAWCLAAGEMPVDLESLEKKTRPATTGSLYRMTQDAKLGRMADPMEYWLPAVEHSAVIYKDTELKTKVKGAFLAERERGYLVFLGGDHPLLIATTSLENGKRALLVKNSYGNAFAPWLLNHFEQVVVVDYRYYTGSVAALVKKHDITDVIILGATSTAISGPHRRRLKAVLRGAGDAWEPVTPEDEKKVEAEKSAPDDKPGKETK